MINIIETEPWLERKAMQRLKEVLIGGTPPFISQIEAMVRGTPGCEIRASEGLRELLSQGKDLGGVLIVQDLLLMDREKRVLLEERVEELPMIVIKEGVLPEELQSWITAVSFDYLGMPLDRDKLLHSLNRAFSYVDQRWKIAQLEGERFRLKKELNDLNQIGIALSAERDLDSLLELILRKSREITAADAGSLYLVEDHGGHNGEPKWLRFKLAQNDSLPATDTLEESLIAINQESIAGYVALTGEMINLPDVYHLPGGFPFSFNPSFDQLTGYRTKSMLVVPMVDHRKEIIGVLQLINRKPSPDVRLNTPASFEQKVIPFDQRCEELVRSLASQAAIAIENASLYQDIQRLFEGFVRAAVIAIESRDPVTKGHSERVASLSVSLARQVDAADTGKFKRVKFSSTELKELYYAALLHDFGKVGVREQVLLKANKLTENNLELIRTRFAYIEKWLELEYCQRKLTWLLSHPQGDPGPVFSHYDREFRGQRELLHQYLALIEEANSPSLLEEEKMKLLSQLAHKKYRDISGEERPYLTPDEVTNLRIRKGCLNEQERKEIESHVTHSYQFLCKIPWTKELQGIPLIAHAHHEWLNGRGYPNRLRDGQIPLQAQIITICDIFDALTAADRPYKKAVPLERALDILVEEAEKEHLDGELVRIFIDNRVYALGGKGEECLSG